MRGEISSTLPYCRDIWGILICGTRHKRAVHAGDGGHLSDYYSTMTSRNWAFLNPEQQERIRTTRIVMAGCGLGSAIALLAAQTGFTEFTLFDHDEVEISNLNRQAFDRSHVGMNKAEALAAVLESRSPDVNVRALGHAVTTDNIAAVVAGADIVVNTVDFDEVTFALNDQARTAGIPVLFPMNMGWGGFCMAFTPDSATLDDLFGGVRPTSDAEFIGRLLGATKEFTLPRYLAERLAELPAIVSAADLPAPQTGIAATRSASLVVEGMVRLTLGLPVRTAPRPMHIDAWDAWD